MRGLSSVSIRSIRIKGDRMDTINTIRSISREFSASYQTERGRPRDSAYVSKLSSNRPLQSLRCGILYYKQSHLASKVTAQMSAPVLFLNTRTVTKNQNHHGTTTTYKNTNPFTYTHVRKYV